MSGLLTEDDLQEAQGKEQDLTHPPTEKEISHTTTAATE